MRPSSNSRAPTAAANLGREHQTALGSGGRHPGSTAENAAAGRSNPEAHSPGVWIRCPQPPLAPAAARRPAQTLAASPLAMAAPIRRKAPREHRGKCGGRARQPRGPLTGCLWDVPPASACRGTPHRPAQALATCSPAKLSVIRWSSAKIRANCNIVKYEIATSSRTKRSMGRQTSVCAVVTPSGGMLLLASLASGTNTLVITVDQVSTALRRAPAERRRKPGSRPCVAEHRGKLAHAGRSTNPRPHACTCMPTHVRARLTHTLAGVRGPRACRSGWAGRLPLRG